LERILEIQLINEQFLLDPNIVYLNHGSFGAAPKPVLHAFQKWQTRLERQPVQFITREMLAELERARKVLAKYLLTTADNLVFVPNATFGINIIARSLQLQPGDEVLASNHEYGACENTWNYIYQKTGASFLKQPIPIPFAPPEEVVEQFWQGVTPNTKVIFLSHITSPTALCMPVEAVCKRAREVGILTIIDGAHAPGQIPLNIAKIDADFYVGNCHKWMLGVKGSGFLHTRPEHQNLVEPLIISWGWGENSPFTTGSKYLDNLEWWGTYDPSAYLTVPTAIQFMEDYDWPHVQRRCHQILAEGIQRINELTGLCSAYSNSAEPFAQMAVAQLPLLEDLSDFQTRLYHQHKIEIPCIQWCDMQFIRVSIQGYNTPSDIDILLNALAEMLPNRKSTVGHKNSSP
jgi:isopenicillin-N epimerase